MKKKKHPKTSQDLHSEKDSFHFKKSEQAVVEAPHKQKLDSEKPGISKSNQYSYTKRGDYFTIAYAGFFALVFLIPGLSVGLLGNDFTAGMICVGIGLLPLKFVFQEIYAIKVTVTKTQVKLVHTALFKKTISWNEPLEYYSHFTKQLSEDESTSMLWHSSDDSKNVLLHTTFYRNRIDALETFEAVQHFLKNSNFGKKPKFLLLKKNEQFLDQNFFEVYNKTKQETRSIQRFLFPDKHIKIVKDEPLIFFAIINSGYRLFLVGFCLLLASFLLLPIVYKIGGVAFWCFIFHFFGILLYNFGTSEQTLKLERRTLSIGKRYFKRKIRVKESIPFANITGVEVLKYNSATEKKDPIYYLKIKTENSFYEFGRCSQKEELEWLAKTIEDRIISINSKFFIKENDY